MLKLFRRSRPKRGRDYFDEIEEQEQRIELISAPETTREVKGVGTKQIPTVLRIESPDPSVFEEQKKQVEALRDLYIVGETLNDNNITDLLGSLPSTKFLQNLHIDVNLQNLELIFTHFSQCNLLKKIELGPHVVLNETNMAALAAFNRQHEIEVLILRGQLPKITDYQKLIEHITHQKSLCGVYMFVKFGFEGYANPEAHRWYDAYMIMSMHDNITAWFGDDVVNPTPSQTRVQLDVSRFCMRNKALFEARNEYDRAYGLMCGFDLLDLRSQNFHLKQAQSAIVNAAYLLSKADEHNKLGTANQGAKHVNAVTVIMNELAGKNRALNAVCQSKVPDLNQQVINGLKIIARSTARRERKKVVDAKSFCAAMEEAPLTPARNTLEKWSDSGRLPVPKWLNEFIDEKEKSLLARNIQAAPGVQYRRG